MTIQVISQLSELITHKDSWNSFAGDRPHLRFEWMVTWWKFYGAGHQLFVLAVRDQHGKICGYAPWFLDSQRSQGTTIRFLGSGKACSDHLTLLCASDQAAEVAVKVADYLSQHSDQWQHLELIGVDADDKALAVFSQSLADSGLLVHHREGVACRVVPIAGSWETYLKQRSKPTRRKLRRHVERCESEGFRVILCDDRARIAERWSDLAALHEKRRHKLGGDGCFGDKNFSDFLLAASCQLADVGMAELSVLEYMSEPIAAELCFVSPTTTYYYQSGMDPDRQQIAPGVMLLAYTAKRSTERGARFLDLMRGDESYKARWRGERLQTVEIRAASRKLPARLRQHAWFAGVTIKDWLKSSSLLAGPTHE